MTCSKCGSNEYIIKSNNVFLPDICEKCALEHVSIEQIEEVAFFCRTYNLFFNPSLYLRLYNENKEHLLYRYTQQLAYEYNAGEGYKDPTTDIWKQVEEEWGKIKRQEELYGKIRPMQEAFIERVKIKWGNGFNFHEYLRLENMFVNTVKNLNIVDPIKLDIVKKVCKSAVILDTVMEGGAAESKQIKEFASAHQTLLKMSGIEEMAKVVSDGDTTIRTVADLYKHMEKNGFQFKFYDDVERDIVDKTIHDIQESIRYEIGNSTGLEATLEAIEKAYIQKAEQAEDEQAIEELPIEDLIDDIYDKVEREADAYFESQDIEIDDGIDYD